MFYENGLDAFFMGKMFYEHGLGKVAELHFDDFGLLAIQGPNIQSTLENIMDIDWVTLPRFIVKWCNSLIMMH